MVAPNAPRARGFAILLVIALGGLGYSNAQAQDLLTGQEADIPEEVRTIRERQAALARAEDVQIWRIDRGKRSSSRLEGIPRELREYTIADEQLDHPVDPDGAVMPQVSTSHSEFAPCTS